MPERSGEVQVGSQRLRWGEQLLPMADSTHLYREGRMAECTALLQRDGYGREYRCATSPAAHAAWAEALRVFDTTAWTADRCNAYEAGREARRRRWEQQQACTGTA